MMSSSVDPAQLVTLNVLLQEGNVTRAARRLGITQSSMSHRLAQLRQNLGDPLFVRAGAGLVPTPRAAAMAQPLADALRALAACVAPEQRFDPSKARFTLQIVMPDLLATLGPRLSAALLDDAPGLKVRVTNIGPALSTELAGDLPSLALTPARFVDDDIQSRALGELRFGVVGRRGHPALRRPLTLERWLAHPHVTVRVGNQSSNVVEDELTRRGLTRRVGIEVPSFLAGLLVVARSNLLMNVPIPLANEAASALGLRLREAPLRLPSIRFALAWHARFQHDSAHRWARERVLEVTRPLFTQPSKALSRLPNE